MSRITGMKIQPLPVPLTGEEMNTLACEVVAEMFATDPGYAMIRRLREQREQELAAAIERFLLKVTRPATT